VTSTVCKDDKQFEEVALTETTDRKCTKITECVKGKTFETEEPSTSADRECTDVTQCESGYGVSKEATLTADQECKFCLGVC
jgi:hypothetical protein